MKEKNKRSDIPKHGINQHVLYTILDSFLKEKELRFSPNTPKVRRQRLYSSVEHAGMRVRRRTETLERVVTYDKEVLQKTWDSLALEFGEEDDYTLFFSTCSFQRRRGKIRPSAGRVTIFCPFGRMG